MYQNVKYNNIIDMSIFNEWRVGASQQMRKSEQLARSDHGNPATGQQPWHLPQFFFNRE